LLHQNSRKNTKDVIISFAQELMLAIIKSIEDGIIIRVDKDILDKNYIRKQDLIGMLYLSNKYLKILSI